MNQPWSSEELMQRNGDVNDLDCYSNSGVGSHYM